MEGGARICVGGWIAKLGGEGEGWKGGREGHNVEEVRGIVEEEKRR